VPEPTALDRLREILERAKTNAPDVPSLMPQRRVPQDPNPPKPYTPPHTETEKEREP